MMPWIVGGQETELFVAKGSNETGVIMIYDPESGEYRQPTSDEMDQILREIDNSRKNKSEKD